MKKLLIWTPFQDYIKWKQDVEIHLQRAVICLLDFRFNASNLLTAYNAEVCIPETEEYEETVFRVKKINKRSMHMKVVVNGKDKTLSYIVSSWVLGGPFPFIYNPYKLLCELLDDVVQEFAQLPY